MWGTDYSQVLRTSPEERNMVFKETGHGCQSESEEACLQTADCDLDECDHRLRSLSSASDARTFPSTPRNWMPLVAARKSWVLAVTLGFATLLGTLMIVQGRSRTENHKFSKFTNLLGLQGKFGVETVAKDLWGDKDPFLFQCPLPAPVMVTNLGNIVAKIGGMLKGGGALRRLDSSFSLSTIPEPQDLGAQIRQDDSAQSLPQTQEDSLAMCCDLYNSSWWPYQYPECKKHDFCDSCFKTSGHSVLSSRGTAAAVAGAAWAAGNAVYAEEKHRAIKLPTDTGPLLAELSTGLHKHITNVCPGVTDWHQYTFENFFDHLRVRAYKSEQAKLAIIAFRGTEPTNIMNWLVDFDTGTEKLDLHTRGKNGPTRTSNVHKGYLDALRLLMPKIDKWVNGFILDWGRVPNDWKLVFAGHSMGGAFTVMAATIAFSEGWERQPDAVVAFGAPRVADGALSDWWEQQGLCDKLLRVNVYNDIVHQLPFAKQEFDARTFETCSKDLKACFSMHPPKRDPEYDSWWRHVCPSSEYLVPGAMKGINDAGQDFNFLGAPLAHLLEQCKYGYGFGIMNSGISRHDKYCGITREIFPRFNCVAVEDLKGKDCSGLRQNHQAKSPEECRASCCHDADGSCEVWQWYKGNQCWTGRSHHCTKFSIWAGDVLESERIK